MALARQVYSAAMFRPEPAFGVITRTQLIIRNAISVVPALGWLIGALIVYQGVSRETAGQA